jgi:hypothetical protein
MKTIDPKIPYRISRASFAAFILLVVSLFFVSPPTALFMFLFYIGLISEALYRALLRIHFRALPEGYYQIRETRTNTELGVLLSRDVDFMRMRFHAQNMKDNNFRFRPSTLEAFLKAGKPSGELSDFLRDAMKGKNEIEIRWEQKGLARYRFFRLLSILIEKE